VLGHPAKYSNCWLNSLNMLISILKHFVLCPWWSVGAPTPQISGQLESGPALACALAALNRTSRLVGFSINILTLETPSQRQEVPKTNHLPSKFYPQIVHKNQWDEIDCIIRWHCWYALHQHYLRFVCVRSMLVEMTLVGWWCRTASSCLATTTTTGWCILVPR